MFFRSDASIWTQITQWIGLNIPNYRQVDEIHEVRETHLKLVTFELNFLEFVELIVATTEENLTSGRQSKYLALKHQLAKAYLDLRPFLLAYIRFDIEDERVGMRTTGFGTDAFEAIWVAPSLPAFIESRDVFFRDRVGRANHAIKDYTEHLHCLLETRV